MPRKSKPRDPTTWDADAGARMRAYFTRARGELGYDSDAELWRYLGVGRDTAQAWMRGERPPRRDVGQKVAEKLGITYADLLAIYDGSEPDVDAASVIKALEWALTRLRSGEWSIERVRAGREPAEVRKAVERAHARSEKQRRSGPPVAGSKGARGAF